MPCLIGLDFGSESARGLLLDAATGTQLAHAVHPYAHGILTAALPDGSPLPPGFALQVADDYLAAAADLLSRLGRGHEIAGIGLDFTASSPLPALADGTPLSARHPDRPHAYVKLWKHAAAQPFAEAINAHSGRGGGTFLENVGGRLSGEWLIPKAAQLAAEAPDLWAETGRFLEAGDWLAWQLTGREARSLDFAAFKAQHLPGAGYPAGIVPGLEPRLADPSPPGTAAGSLAADWRRRTGIADPARVAVAMIDSHVVLPAVGAIRPGDFVGALGTSAAFLVLADSPRPLPPGLEGAAFGAVLPGLWCAEAGQAAFGDMLGWFARHFPLAADPAENFARHAAVAAAVPPGSGGLLALDWFGGNRVPHGDPGLSGLLAGLTLAATPAAIYRALVESLAYGTRAIIDAARGGRHRPRLPRRRRPLWCPHRPARPPRPGGISRLRPLLRRVPPPLRRPRPRPGAPHPAPPRRAILALGLVSRATLLTPPAAAPARDSADAACRRRRRPRRCRGRRGC